MCSYRWSLIAGRLPGRTDNEIKNYWNTHIRRKLLNRGVDPTTHRPIHETAASATISLGKEGEKVIGFMQAKEARRNQDAPPRLRCPDLNLELCISPPTNQDPPESLKRGRSLCFSCSLGLKRSKDCSCNGFLGLETGVLDYRSLEMKWWNGFQWPSRLWKRRKKKKTKGEEERGIVSIPCLFSPLFSLCNYWYMILLCYIWVSLFIDSL